MLTNAPAPATTKPRPRVAVLKADGTNCEQETRHAFEKAGARAEIVPMNCLRWKATRLAEFDILAVPGGFSYGDDVVSGKIMAVEMMSFLADEMAEFAAARKPILGICNGFQVLVRTGLLPFGTLGTMSATLGQNLSGRYECRWVHLAKNAAAPMLAGLPDRFELPVAHGEGRFYAAPEVLDRIEAMGLVALRYTDAAGGPAEAFPANPNGALHAIAGITDPTGRILGLMPHPERFVERFHHPDWRRLPAELRPHGIGLFEGIVALA
jgi:phosphoribosylformylglycinamidine synthase